MWSKMERGKGISKQQILSDFHNLWNGQGVAALIPDKQTTKILLEECD